MNALTAASWCLHTRRPERRTIARDGTERLAAVEYFVADADQDLASDDGLPLMFDRLPFVGPMPGHDPTMPVHDDLHVWLYDHTRPDSSQHSIPR